MVTKNCHEGSPLFSVFGHTYLRASPQSHWEGVSTKDAGNQHIAKSVRKGSTKIDHVTSLYLKWVAQKLQLYNDARFSSIIHCTTLWVASVWSGHWSLLDGDWAGTKLWLNLSGVPWTFACLGISRLHCATPEKKRVTPGVFCLKALVRGMGHSSPAIRMPVMPSQMGWIAGIRNRFFFFFPLVQVCTCRTVQG